VKWGVANPIEIASRLDILKSGAAFKPNVCVGPSLAARVPAFCRIHGGESGEDSDQQPVELQDKSIWREQAAHILAEGSPI
jgi:hypothetical protein